MGKSGVRRECEGNPCTCYSFPCPCECLISVCATVGCAIQGIWGYRAVHLSGCEKGVRRYGAVHLSGCEKGDFGLWGCVFEWV